MGHYDIAQKGESSGQEAPRRGFPIVTLVVVIVTALVTGSQFAFPRVLSALRRNPEALAAGQWWRILSPLLVDPDGWLAIVAVLVGIVVIGIECERVFGHRWWILLYLAGALAGEIAGYAWLPHDAGSSIALCGLIGGLFVALLYGHVAAAFSREPKGFGMLALVYALGVVGALVGGSAGSILAAVLCGVLPASVLVWLARFRVPARLIAIYTGSVGLLGAVALTFLHDLHGPALLAGACVAALIFRFVPALRHGVPRELLDRPTGKSRT